MSVSLYDLARQALIGALDDGEINADDFDDWKRFKRQVLKRLRRIFRDVEEEGVEIAPEDAALLLVILARMD